MQSSSSQGLAYGLAGALLLELALAERIEERSDGLAALDGAPGGDELVDAALREIGGSERPRKAAHWVRRLPRLLKPLKHRVAERLAARGLVGIEEGRLLFLRRRRYPLADPEAAEAVRRRVREAAVGPGRPDARTAMLVALARTCGALDRCVERGERRVARGRAEELTRGEGLAHAVSGTVTRVQAATTAAVLATTSTAADVGD